MGTKIGCLLFLFVFCFCFLTPAEGFAGEGVPNDKIAHFATGLIMAGIFKGLSIDENLNEKQINQRVLTLVIFVAAAKEITDKKFDWGDFGATILGGMIPLQFKIKF